MGAITPDSSFEIYNLVGGMILLKRCTISLDKMRTPSTKNLEYRKRLAYTLNYAHNSVHCNCFELLYCSWRSYNSIDGSDLHLIILMRILAFTTTNCIANGEWELVYLFYNYNSVSKLI
jgi:hypothetical protein